MMAKLPRKATRLRRYIKCLKVPFAVDNASGLGGFSYTDSFAKKLPSVLAIQNVIFVDGLKIHSPKLPGMPTAFREPV